MKDMRSMMNLLAAQTSTVQAAGEAAGEAAGGVQQGVDLQGVVDPIVGLINSFRGPMIGLVVAIGSIYCILLGVKLAKAEEPQEREKAKAHLKNAIIGFVLIFVLIVALNLLVGPLTTWMTGNI